MKHARRLTTVACLGALALGVASSLDVATSQHAAVPHHTVVPIDAV